LILSLSSVPFAGFKAEMMASNFLISSVALVSSFAVISVIAKLAPARAKFSEVAYRGHPSFFAPSNLFIKDTHGHFRFVV
jgi:hypothetical protein